MPTPNLTPTHNHNWWNKHIFWKHTNHGLYKFILICHQFAKMYSCKLPLECVSTEHYKIYQHLQCGSTFICRSQPKFFITRTITIYVNIFHCNYFKCKLWSSNLTGQESKSAEICLLLYFCHLESTNLLSYSKLLAWVILNINIWEWHK